MLYLLGTAYLTWATFSVILLLARYVQFCLTQTSSAIPKLRFASVN
jgi:hypothetical protein